jgi:hypothetical protein
LHSSQSLGQRRREKTWRTLIDKNKTTTKMDNKNLVVDGGEPIATDQVDPQRLDQDDNVGQQQINVPPPPDYFSDDLPPAYQVASALPTYEESELTKGTYT